MFNLHILSNNKGHPLTFQLHFLPPFGSILKQFLLFLLFFTRIFNLRAKGGWVLGVVMYLWNLYNMQTIFSSVLQTKYLVRRSGRRIKFNDLRRSPRLHLPSHVVPQASPLLKTLFFEQHILTVINKWVILALLFWLTTPYSKGKIPLRD
jgi:hypothetical protein